MVNRPKKIRNSEEGAESVRNNFQCYSWLEDTIFKECQAVLIGWEVLICFHGRVVVSHGLDEPKSWVGSIRVENDRVRSDSVCLRTFIHLYSALWKLHNTRRPSPKLIYYVQ